MLVKRKIAILAGGAFVAGFAFNVLLEHYFLDTRPAIIEATEGRTYVLNVRGFVVYLTKGEHLLVELSFWLPFCFVVAVLVLRQCSLLIVNGQDDGSHNRIRLFSRLKVAAGRALGALRHRS